jgi:SAM-dependent methyltransferase
MESGDYLRSNRDLWDRMTPIHARSDFYDVEGFKAGRNTLLEIDRREVGDVSGRRLLHLQCHFGMDTLSWARLGARITGMDFSPRAIALAGALAAELEIPAEFYCCELTRFPRILRRMFDIVYTSGGVLPWLPDLGRWADAAARFVEPGGFFYVRDDHPFCAIFADDEDVDEPRVGYPYFHSDRPMRFVDQGTYADPAADITSESYEWFHSLSDVINALISSGLRIEYVHEFPFASYRSLPFLVRGGDGLWRYSHRPESLPLSFSIRAVKDP